jgi:hypothetical protein
MSSGLEYVASIDANEKVDLQATQEQVLVNETNTKTKISSSRSIWRSGSNRNSIFNNRSRPIQSNTTTTTTQRLSNRSVSHSAYITLTIRKRTNGTTDIMLHASEGEFAPEYATGQQMLKVRFDQTPAENYAVIGAADHDAGKMFILTGARFIKKLKKARTLLIQASIVDNGTNIMEFDVHNFKWTH